MPKNLVIVESPAKAKTIEKYLGNDFKVLSSVGHIRKDTKVDKDHDFAVTYEIDPEHKKVVDELKKAAKTADTIWLATDEDREGESISWHLIEVLGLPKNTKRITFHEITEPALKDAIAHPRTVDMDMVASQQARQTLDMLVGYDLSGVVRVKVPGAISAGRVQSPALKLIVEREREIENYQPETTYKVSGVFKTAKKQEFEAVLEKTAEINTDQKAEKLLSSLKGQKFVVSSVTMSDGTRANPVPLTTAALQIEANSKLGFSSRTTMSAAQSLYQAGLITYHRTDSLNLSKQAIGQIAGFIEKKYGKEYLHIRTFKTKSAGAQEAHEAIRPTNVAVEKAGKTPYEQKLYNLIRTRTLATQMENAKVAKTTVAIEVASDLAEHKSEVQQRAGGALRNGSARPLATFIARGEIVIFDGFLKVYGKSKDLELPELKEGDKVGYQEIVAHQTFSKPPARYTEGSLVKKLEELGIGRPSTYASIMTAIQARGYVIKGESEGREREVTEYVLKKDLKKQSVTEKTGSDKGKLLPTPVGELVSDFLNENFETIIDYGFTADVEEKLDKIAEKKLEKLKMLKDFYGPFSKLIAGSKEAKRYNGENALGKDPKTGKNIYAKIGRTGSFIQLGETEKESGEKPRFVPLPEGKTVKTVTLEDALKQLELPELPRSLGEAKDGTEIIAANGPFGPYLKAGKFNIPMKDYSPYKITLKEAEKLYEEKKASILQDFDDIQVINGAYGPYVKGPGRRNFAKIPKEMDPKNLTKAECEKLLSEKKSGSRHRPHSVSRKKSAKKAASRKK